MKKSQIIAIIILIFVAILIYGSLKRKAAVMTPIPEMQNSNNGGASPSPKMPSGQTQTRDNPNGPDYQPNR